MSKRMKILLVFVVTTLLILTPFIIYLIANGTNNGVLELSPNSIEGTTETWNFTSDNMLPGDSSSKKYKIKTFSSEECNVGVIANIVSSTNNLENALEITIINDDNGKTVFSGDLSELLTEEKTDSCSSGSITHTYEITIKFKESAGNEFKDSNISLSFNWKLLLRSDDNMNKKLFISILGIVLVVFFASVLAITSFIHGKQSLEEKGVYVSTGNIRINLNDNKKILDGTECFFEPGGTYQKDFTIENLSKCPVWYDIYFENVSSSMADYITITIKDGNKIVSTGTLSHFSQDSVVTSNNYLSVMERKTLTMVVDFAQEVGNEYQSTDIIFDVCATATQGSSK